MCPHNMKKTFEEVFNLLSEIVCLFGERDRGIACDDTEMQVVFKETYSTKRSDIVYSCLIKSELLGYQRFSGTENEVINQATYHCYEMAIQLIQSMLSHKSLWFKDSPDLQEKVVDLFFRSCEWLDHSTKKDEMNE